jgi:hypothetical protein
MERAPSSSLEVNSQESRSKRKNEQFQNGSCTTGKLRIAVVLVLLPVLMCPGTARAEAPSTATITLSLKTISKALAGCREIYTQVLPGATMPLIKQALGAEAYEKDMQSLGNAETVTNGLIKNPDKIAGKWLVLVLSLSDDFALGAAATQVNLVMSFVKSDLGRGSQSADQILLVANTLGSCQRSLFNAGDDFVNLVSDFVGAEDDALIQANQLLHRKK